MHKTSFSKQNKKTHDWTSGCVSRGDRAVMFADEGHSELRQSDTGLAGRRVTAIRYFTAITPANH